MRLLLIILMLALLPLRGGAACTLVMDHGVLEIALNNIASSPYTTRADDHFDAQDMASASPCPGHATVPDAPATGSHPAHHAHASAHCSTCAACFSLIATPSALPASGSLATHTRPSAAPARFSSVSASPALRPPIL